MSFIRATKCYNQHDFMAILNEIDRALSISYVDKSAFDRISKFFDDNIQYIVNNKAATIQLYSITACVIRISIDDPLISKVQQLFPGYNKEDIESFHSFLKDNAKNFTKSLADWINIMQIPLSTLNLSTQQLYNLIPYLKYIDLCNLDFSKYKLQGFNFELDEKNFRLKVSDEETLFNIAKHITLQTHKYCSPEMIKNLGMKNKTHLFEIAKLYVSRRHDHIFQCIKDWGIDDKTHLFKIAKLHAKKKDARTAESIKKFGIEDKAHLLEIAMICVQQDCWVTANHIQDFRIEDQTHLYEIAKLCAQKDGHATAKFFKNFGIEDKIQSYEIAKLCAQQSCGGTAEFIRNFGIEDKKHLHEIVMICAKKSSGCTAEYINNFGIEDQTYLYEIAMICAQSNDWRSTAEHIQNFRIVDKTQLYEIAKLCARMKGWSTAQHIKNFGIDDKAHLFEIAMLCAQKHPRATVENIKNFGIDDKTHLFELAKLCIENDMLKTLENIKNLGIEDKSHLYEIVKLCAQQNGEGTAEHIKQFGVEDKAHLFEIAKLCAQQNGEKTARYIRNFGIEDNIHLYKIAKLCSRQSEGTAEHIKNFRIENKIHLYKIAKLCAQKNGNTAIYIKNFGIEDKTHLFELAKICAKDAGGHVIVDYIDKFGIDDKMQLFEIAKIGATNLYSATTYLRKFKIDDPQQRWEVFLEYFNGKNEALHSISYFYPLPDGVGKNPILLAGLLHNILNKREANRDEFFIRVKSLIDELPCSIKNKLKLVEISDKIANLDIYIQNEAAVWFLKCLFLSIQMKQEDLDWMLTSKLWDELAKLREPRLRSLLTPGLFELSKSDRYVPMGTHGLPLIAIPFFQLQKQGVSENKLKKIAKILKQGQNKGNNNPLKNVVIVQTILHTAHLLASTNSLSLKEKIRGMDKILFKQDESEETDAISVLKKIKAVRCLLQMRNREWTKPHNNPLSEFLASFQRLIPVDYEGDISERYDEIFGPSRNPYGLITYAAGLKTLNEPKLMKCLGEYVSAVFKGTFKEKRYETTNNPHLKKLSESHADLLQQWKEDFKPLEISLEGEIKEVFDPREWIKTKLITDRHLRETPIPFIEDYFKANTAEERDLVSKKLTEKLEKKRKKLTLTTLKLQQACIAFAESQPDNIIPLLEVMQVSLQDREANFTTTEFAHEVTRMLQSLKNPKVASSNLKIGITDDPIDLLLCGTDVIGSCQRIDGCPGTNKALLGYILDGKNRLLAIKDSKGKIVARCIIRLLWDGERPVIYRERFYVNNSDARMTNALNDFAKKLAKTLKTPLTCSDEGTSYGRPLRSFGGPVLYEYCDGMGGTQSFGIYTIQDVRLIPT